MISTHVFKVKANWYFLSIKLAGKKKKKKKLAGKILPAAKNENNYQLG